MVCYHVTLTRPKREEVIEDTTHHEVWKKLRNATTTSYLTPKTGKKVNRRDEETIVYKNIFKYSHVTLITDCNFKR